MAAMRHNFLIFMRVPLYFAIIVIWSQLYGCWSNTGKIEYMSVNGAAIKEPLESNAAIAILDFHDKRPILRGIGYSKKLGFKPKPDLVGIFWGAYKISLRKLYSHQAIILEVIDALADLFEANGFRARKYDGSRVSVLSDERLSVKGQINKFFIDGYPAWRGTSPSIAAEIDIDVMIIDRKYQKTIWTGKLEGYQKMSKSQGVFTGARKIFSFFNLLFSSAIEKAWIDDGMLEALESLDKKASLKKVEVESRNPKVLGHDK
jgi:hypothetical protein